jgi:molecular chaperone HscB
VDYFEYFGIPAKFQLDLNELRKRYYEKSRSLHPDIQNSDKDDQLVLSAYNNQAYQTLVDPINRLKYIIENSTGPIQENHSLLSQDFLMDMMDLHEQVNEARGNANTVLIENFKNQLNILESKALEDANSQIVSFDSGDRNDTVINGLTVYYFKLKYFKRLKQAIEGGSVEL